LGLPLFLLPDGRHSSTPFGSLPSSILWTCLYHWSCLSFYVVYIRYIHSPSICFRIDFFLNNRTRAIHRQTHHVLSTNIRSHTEFRLFIFDSVRVMTCKVGFLYTSWMTKINSFAIIFFFL
jgi:hypothetical protein